MKNIKECLRLQGKGAYFENLPRGGPPDVPSNMNKKKIYTKKYRMPMYIIHL